MPKGMGKSDLSVPSQFLLPLRILVPPTFLDAPGGQGGHPAPYRWETEAHVPHAQSGVFFTPPYYLLGDPTKPLFVRPEASQKLWQLPWATPTRLVRTGPWLPL